MSIILVERMDVFEIIDSWRNHSSYRDYLNPGCNDAKIEKLQLAAKEFGFVIPQSFIRLLKISNGIQIDGVFFKEAENLIAENLDLESPEAIVLGNSGNVEAYIFDLRDGKFHTVNIFDFEEKFESYATFEAMLLAIIEVQMLKQ